MKIMLKPEPRVEKSYRGKLTVLEGGELRMLEKAFHAFMKSKKMPKDMEHRIWLAAPYAYQRLYGKDAVVKDEMRKLNTGDARRSISSTSMSVT